MTWSVATPTWVAPSSSSSSTEPSTPLDRGDLHAVGVRLPAAPRRSAGRARRCRRPGGSAWRGTYRDTSPHRSDGHHRRRFPPTPPRIYTAGGLEIGLPAGRRRRRRQRAPVSAGVILAILILVAARPASAAQGGAAQCRAVPVPRSAPVTAIHEPITIDGALDEPVWRSAPKIGELIQRQPDDGAAADASAPTSRCSHDATTSTSASSPTTPSPSASSARRWRATPALGCRRSHRDPARHVPRSAERVLFRDQPGRRAGRRPGVRQRAAEHRVGRHLGRAHDAARPTGWIAEFAIPFKSLSFPAGPGRLGLQHRPHTSIASSRTTAGRARASTRSSFRCPKPARSRTSAGSRRASASTSARSSPDAGCTWRTTAATTSRGKPGSISSTTSRRASSSPRRSTPTSARRKSTRARSTSRASRCCSPRSARSSSRAPACSALPAPARSRRAASRPPAPTCTRSSAGRSACSAAQEVPIDAGVKLTGTVGRTDVGVLDVRTGDLIVASAGRRREELLRRPRQAEPVPAVVRRRASSPTAIRPPGSRARPTAPTCAWPPRVSSGGQRNFVVNAYARQKRQPTATRSDDWSYGFSAHYPNDKFDRAGRRSARSRRTSGRRSASCSGTTCGCSGSARSYNPRPKTSSTSSRCSTTSTTRGSRGSTTARSRAGICTSRCSTGTSSRATTCTACSTSTRPTSGCSSRSRSRRACVSCPGEYRFTRFRSNLLVDGDEAPRCRAASTSAWGNYWSGEAEQVTAASPTSCRRGSRSASPRTRRSRGCPKGDFIGAHLHRRTSTTPPRRGCRSRT